MMNTLGPFQILEVLGRGGMGTVYRGLDPIIGRPVAVKVIRLIGYNDAAERSWLRDRLFREARAAGSLSHPSIVTIYQVGEEADVAYIAMELVEGCTLQQMLDKDGYADKANLCRILQETANALDHAHEKGLVHRDIKPANIMLSVTGATKVTDFGIAKSALNQTATQTGTIMGTVFYMSPEQVRGETLDGRSDQFALAVIAYEIFTGRKPFQAEHTTSICYQIIHEEPLSPSDLNPVIGEQLASVIKRGLAKKASDRYPTCSQFTEALTAALATPSSAQQPPITPIPPKPQAPTQIERKNRIPWAIATALLLPLLGTVIYRVVNQPAPTPSIPQVTIPQPPSVASPKIEQPPPPPPPAEPVSEVIAPPLKNEPKDIPPTPQPIPKLRGTLIWTGNATKGMIVTISGTFVSIGTLSGRLPGKAVRIQVHPAELTKQGLTVFTSNPNYATPVLLDTPRGPANFTFDPRHATDIAVFEQPGPANNWERVVFQVNIPNLSGCVIEWFE